MKKILMIATLCCFYAVSSFAATPQIPVKMLQWRASLTREVQFVYGINGPTPLFAGQIMQESGGNATVVAFDGGIGLGQFMPNTSKQIASLYPALGPPNPTNPVWSMRALIDFDGWIMKKMKGANDCEKFGATLKGYNAGPGYPIWEQEKSSTPTIWFTKTEDINVKQTEKNFTYSRMYPRAIIFSHQPLFRAWGTTMCDIDHPPPGAIHY